MTEESMMIRVEAAIRKAAYDIYGTHLVNAGTEMARAAIEAMREPTKPMVLAALSDGNNAEGRPLWKQTVDVQARARWQAMIDTALADQGEA